MLKLYTAIVVKQKTCILSFVEVRWYGWNRLFLARASLHINEEDLDSRTRRISFDVLERRRMSMGSRCPKICQWTDSEPAGTYQLADATYLEKDVQGCIIYLLQNTTTTSSFLVFLIISFTRTFELVAALGGRFVIVNDFRRVVVRIKALNWGICLGLSCCTR